MSWHFLQEQEEVSSEAISWDGEQFAPSNGPTILGGYCLLDSETGSCPDSRSGMMSRPSTGSRGEDGSMSSQADSHARTSAQPGKAQESTVRDPECGFTWQGSFARYDPDSSSWRTPQCSLLEGLDVYSETWPRWGMMRNGGCWELTTLAPRTSATESGLLPTPLASIATHGGPNQRDSSGRPGLQMAAMKWPTPLSGEGSGGGNAGYALAAINGEKRKSGATRSLKLRDAVLAFPTPTVCGNYNKKGASAKSGDGLATQAGGALNPDWVEGLMGWPMNWTCVKPMSELDFASWEMGFMDENEGSYESAMRMLRKVFDQEAVWGATGRPDSLRETALLLAELCEHANRPDQARLFMACAEAPQGGVRGMRGISVAASTPCGPEKGKQRAGEYSDALPALSQLLARYGKKAWEDGSWENAIPRVTKSVASRMDRLKAIGNGQVPLCATLAWSVLSKRLA